MITIEEIHEAYIKQVIRATAAEDKVKRLEAENTSMKHRIEDGTAENKRLIERLHEKK